MWNGREREREREREGGKALSTDNTINCGAGCGGGDCVWRLSAKNSFLGKAALNISCNKREIL